MFEILETVEARRSRHARSEDHVVESQQFVIVGHGFLIMDIQSHAAEPAGAQGFDQGLAVDDRGVRHIDDAGAAFDLRKFGAAQQVARAGPGWQLRDDPVAFGQQGRKRHVARLELALLGARRACPLMVEHIHIEGPGSDGNLASDFAQANDADGRTVEGARAAEPDVVAAGGMAPLERPVCAAGGLDALDRHQAVEFVKLPRQQQDQAESMLGAGDVGATPQRQQLDAFLGAGGAVDVA